MCGKSTNNTRNVLTAKDTEVHEGKLGLNRDYSEAHVYGVGGVSQETDGNEIYASFGVGADVLETNAAGALDGYAAVML